MFSTANIRYTGNKKLRTVKAVNESTQTTIRDTWYLFCLDENIPHNNSNNGSWKVQNLCTSCVFNVYVFQDFVFGIKIELLSVSSEEEGLCVLILLLLSDRGVD